jgi:hypothetical protein
MKLKPESKEKLKQALLMLNDSQAKVLMFNDGCIYYANRKEKPMGDIKPKELGFYTVVFYQEFSCQNVIASFKEYAQEKPYIRKLVDKDTSKQEMQELCLDALVSVLKDDPRKDWFSGKVFVPGKFHETSVRDYVNNQSTSLKPGCLDLSYVIPLKYSI